MSKFLLREAGMVSPTSCLVCNGAGDQPMFDTHVDIPLHGRVNICASCIVQAAHQLNMLTPEEADVLRSDLAASRAEHTKLLGQSQAMLKAYQAFKEFEDAEHVANVQLHEELGVKYAGPLPLEEQHGLADDLAKAKKQLTRTRSELKTALAPKKDAPAAKKPPAKKAAAKK